MFRLPYASCFFFNHIYNFSYSSLSGFLFSVGFPVLSLCFSSFSLVFSPHSLLSSPVCEPSAWVQPPSSSLYLPPVLPLLSSFGSGRNFQSPLLPSFPSDGAVLVQTWAAQRLVARAGQCGTLGGCVSLFPHLWDGLRLSVVSTPPAPPPARDHIIKLMSNKTIKKSEVESSLTQNDSSPEIMCWLNPEMWAFPLSNTVN